MTESPDWRARRWAATHQRIYDAALELFQRDGFDHVTVAQIVREAGVSVPTFYAHYPSKEHLVMQLPTADDVAALLATQPAELTVGERIRRAAPMFFAQWDMGAQLVRWRIIATTPSLRRRAAEFERTTAELVAGALPSAGVPAPGPGEAALINAYLAAFTTGVLAWADGNGERKIEELVDEAFDALEHRR
ncbi:UNVERIFIED_ORG: TetR family transcriptional regulator [Bacillus sp. AZ43]